MKKLLLALLVFLGVERFCYFQTDGFILSKMLLENIPPSPSTPFHQNIDIGPRQSPGIEIVEEGGSIAEIQPPSLTTQSRELSRKSNVNVLMKWGTSPSETLTFIGAGKQFYAFETADHQYVVKFMKFSRRRPLPWLEKLTFLKSWSASYLAERAKRLSNLEYSCALALKYLSEEAALAPYTLPKNLILIDKLGIAHSIDTAQTKFVMQKKAAAFTLYFDQNPSQAQALISSYIKTISSQCRKGICNLDPIIERNYGVVGNQMILMDIGSLLADPKLNHKAGVQREIFLELLPLREWLQNNHPQHVDYFDLIAGANARLSMNLIKS